MRLLDLNPRWIYKAKVFTFRCPHCRSTWLTCKRVVMGNRQQREIIEAAFGEDYEHEVVGCRDDKAWSMTSTDFAAITCHPSLDASAAGHWHGHIRNGVIDGGHQCSLTQIRARIIKPELKRTLPHQPPGSIVYLYSGVMEQEGAPFGMEHTCPCGCGELSFCGFAPHYKGDNAWKLDGTLQGPTLSPRAPGAAYSVKVRHACGWHGYLENGIWRKD